MRKKTAILYMVITPWPGCCRPQSYAQPKSRQQPAGSREMPLDDPAGPAGVHLSSLMKDGILCGTDFFNGLLRAETGVARVTPVRETVSRFLT